MVRVDGVDIGVVGGGCPYLIKKTEPLCYGIASILHLVGSRLALDVGDTLGRGVSCRANQSFYFLHVRYFGCRRQQPLDKRYSAFGWRAKTVWMANSRPDGREVEVATSHAV